MTASEMREIAHKKSNFDIEVERRIQSTEKNVREAAEKGVVSMHFCSVYRCSDVDEKVMSHFEKLGFTFKQEQRVIGGVLQNPSYYIHW